MDRAFLLFPYTAVCMRTDRNRDPIWQRERIEIGNLNPGL